MQGQVLFHRGHRHRAIQHLFVAKPIFNLLHIHLSMSLFSVPGARCHLTPCIISDGRSFGAKGDEHRRRDQTLFKEPPVSVLLR